VGNHHREHRAVANTPVPNDPQAEWSVVGQMLARPEVIGEVVGTQLEGDDFFSRDCRLVFEAVVEMHYADQKVDPITVGERLRSSLATIWGCDEGEIAGRLANASIYRSHYDNTAVEHSKVVRRYGDLRRIQFVAQGALEAIKEGVLTPEEIGDRMTTEAARITAGAAKRAELLTFTDVGREYIKILRQTKAAHDAGLRIGVHTEMPFVDFYTKGLKPTELWMFAGEPGVGKSAVAWTVGEQFARYQKKLHLTRRSEALRQGLGEPEDKRIGTLILSMEMGLEPSGGRLAQSLTGFDGGRLREGDVSDDEMKKLVMRWAGEEELPLIFNFAPNFRMSQMRALIVEAIRKHNIGFVIIDHFRMFDPDRKVNNPNQEDEAKVRFLKENIAKELNVAVMCLAHTVKISREGSDGRPTLRDLRGSYQVAAHCDIVSFMYRPIMYASENEINEGTISPTTAEMIYSKNRNGALGSMDFHADFSKMVIRSRA
jgi:replicative DNA helicase